MLGKKRHSLFKLQSSTDISRSNVDGSSEGKAEMSGVPGKVMNSLGGGFLMPGKKRNSLFKLNADCEVVDDDQRVDKPTQVQQKDMARVLEAYENVMQLFQKNKVDTKNSWSLDLIENLSQIIDSQQGSFQKAGQALEASVHIYEKKVDSIKQDALHLMKSVSDPKNNNTDGNDNTEVNDCDNVAEHADSEDENNEHIAKNKKDAPGKRKDPVSNPDKHIVKDKTKLQIDPKTLCSKPQPPYDPLFFPVKKLAAEVGGEMLFSNGILSRMEPRPSLDLLTLTPKELDSLEELCEEIFPAHNHREVNDKLASIDVSIFTNKLEMIEKTTRDQYCAYGVEDPYKSYGNLDLGEAFKSILSMPPCTQEALGNPEKSNNDVNTSFYDEGNIGFEDAGEVSGYAELNHGSEKKMDEQLWQEAEYNFQMVSRLLAPESQLKDISIHKFEFGALGWAGPSHWKFPSIIRESTAKGNRQDKSAVKHRVKTQEKKITFVKLKASVFKKPKTKSSIKLKMKPGQRQKNFLPLDSMFDPNTLEECFFWPNRKVVLSTDNGSFQFANDPKRDTTLCAPIQANSWEDFTADDRDFDYEEDFEPSSFPTIKTLQEKENFDISTREEEQLTYARRAKKVDIRLLKSTLWHEVEKSKTGLDRVRESLSPMKCSSSSSNQKGFVETMANVADTLCDDDITVPYYFLSILHLANEKHLELVGTINMDDFKIRIT